MKLVLPPFPELELEEPEPDVPVGPPSPELGELVVVVSVRPPLPPGAPQAYATAALDAVKKQTSIQRRPEDALPMLNHVSGGIPLFKEGGAISNSWVRYAPRCTRGV